MLGDASKDVKELGPVQLKVEPAMSVAVKLSVVPEHAGDELLSVGAGGMGFTVTLIVAVDEQDPRVAVTV